MSKYVKVRDEVSWKQFGAPDPGFFDNHIKDVWLVVLQTGSWYCLVQDPTDINSEFVVFQDLLIFSDQIQRSA